MLEFYIVPDDAYDLPEQLGTKFKFWFRGENGKDYLFKEGRLGTGENWAEVVSSRLCDILGIPHAIYDLASWRNQKGVISENFVPIGCRLVHGNELLIRKSKNAQCTQLYKRKEHPLRMVLAVMKSVSTKPPLGFNPFNNVKSALDVFIAYLMFDAWIANQDRHDENWGLIRTPEKQTYLAPTYDHASSLGRNESDQVKKFKLTTNDQRQNLQFYVERAKSAFFSSGAVVKRLSTIDAFIKAAKHSKSAAINWIEKLESISDEKILSAFEHIPNTELSDIGIEFGQKILFLNKRRLIDSAKDLK